MRQVSICLLFSFLFSTGKYGDSFLKIGTSARDIGLGQAIVADMGNASGFNICPASIASINTRTFYFLIVDQYGLAEYYSGGMVLPLKNNQFASFNISTLIIDDIQLRPDLGYIGSYEERRDVIRGLFDQGYGSFNDLEVALTSTFVKMTKGSMNMGLNNYSYQMPIGINTRLIKKKLYDKEAYGIGFDLGGIFSLELADIFNYNWLGQFAIGISINNVYGTHLFWSNDLKDVIPMQIISGFSYEQPIKRFDSKVLFLCQKNDIYPNDAPFGIEFAIMKKLFVRIGNRAGLNQGGLGFSTKIKHFKKIRVDYSFGGHDLGDAHRLGFELKF